MDKPHGSALRRGRHSEPGQIYLITTVTAGRCRLLANFTSARLVIRALKHHENREVTTLAYVLMPDHLHWLVQLRCDHLDDLMRRFKAFSALMVNRQLERTGPLWQKGYHDHGVRAEEDLRRLARYVVANPLRAGLVERIGEWPHWDAIWL